MILIMIKYIHCLSSNKKGGQHHTILRIIPSTMSSKGSNKRSGVPVSSGDGHDKRLRTTNDNESIAGFDNIPTECKTRILQFQDVDDLASIAQVSHCFNESSLHPLLPQNRTVTLTCVRRLDKSTGTLSASPLPLLQKLRDKGTLDQYRRFIKVRIIGHNLLENVEKVSHEEARNVVPDLRTLPHVQVLDLSFPSNALQKDKKFKVCVSALLSRILPCLREIDLSYANVAESALRNFAGQCPELEKITWGHHHGNTNMSGKTLSACRFLKELYMDNSVFTFSIHEAHRIHESGDDCIFGRCNTFLERVSLKAAGIRFAFKPCTFPTLPMYQSCLIKFVRKTPSLRWFRSDLSPEFVAILQAERPEVTFV
jgi:hypothetical protein